MLGEHCYKPHWRLWGSQCQGPASAATWAALWHRLGGLKAAVQKKVRRPASRDRPEGAALVPADTACVCACPRHHHPCAQAARARLPVPPQLRKTTARVRPSMRRCRCQRRTAAWQRRVATPGMRRASTTPRRATLRALRDRHTRCLPAACLLLACCLPACLLFGWCLPYLPHPLPPGQGRGWKQGRQGRCQGQGWRRGGGSGRSLPAPRPRHARSRCRRLRIWRRVRLLGGFVGAGRHARARWVDGMRVPCLLVPVCAPACVHVRVDAHPPPPSTTTTTLTHA
jgi:hypothetical protein